MASEYFLGDSRTNYDRMIAGDFYISDDHEITAKQQRAISLAGEFQAAFLKDVDLAQDIVRQLLGAVGTDTHVRAPIFVDYGFNITVGAGTFINYNLTALDVATIKIGNHCQIGPNVQLLTPTHPLEATPRRDKLEAARPIVIGDNVWLGGGVIVLAGVTIGENSVVGAGSVVTRDLPSDVLAVGTPAKVVKSISR